MIDDLIIIMWKSKNHHIGHGPGLIFSFFSCYVLILLSANVLNCECSKIVGHLRNLGSHREPLGITWAGKFSSPSVFYNHFVDHEKPVIMKGALEHVDHPGLRSWTDDFLSDKFGSEIVKVEQSKFENRDANATWVPLKKFLNSYQTEDVYLVHSLTDRMKELVFIPSTLQCGGFQKMIHESVLWMGSHTASSVLHRDPLDNLLCVMNGRKYAVLIDKAYKNEVEESGFDKLGGFSSVNPQEVDFEKYPRLAQVNWHEANLEKGDCLFIPQGWYHQVTSSGFRHVSVNIWFSRLWWFNATDCPDDISIYKPLEPISTFGFASPNEAYRSKLLSLFKNQGILNRYLLRDLLPSNPSQERANEFFDAINQFPDGALSWSELYAFDIDKVLPQFWDLFDLLENPTTIKEQEPTNGDIDDVESIRPDKFLIDSDPRLFPNDDNAHTEITENDANRESSVNDEDKVKDQTVVDDENDEMVDLPLPDAVSGNTPSLPDSSVDNPVYELNSHSDWKGEEDSDEDEDGGAESLDGFCHDEDCGKEETSEEFYQFTESSESDGVSTGTDDADFEAKKILKDEL